MFDLKSVYNHKFRISLFAVLGIFFLFSSVDKVDACAAACDAETVSHASVGKLSEFDYEAYNALQDPEGANMALRSRDCLSEFLEKALDKIDESGLDLGFRLIHRHGLLAKGEVMVESYTEVEGTPSLVTTHTTYDSDKHWPASWICTEDGIKAFEYTDDVYVMDKSALLLSNYSLVTDISQMLRDYNLDSLLAPAILNRSNKDLFAGDGIMLEKTYLSPFMSVVQLDTEHAIDDEKVIRTVWGCQRVHGCFSVSACVGNGSTHVSVRHHK